jgi:hypothetical protein
MQYPTGFPSVLATAVMSSADMSSMLNDDLQNFCKRCLQEQQEVTHRIV